VSAVEKSTGKSNKITIQNDKSRTKEDIERMVAEAERYAAEDKQVMERIETRNGMESYLYNARNTLREEKVKEVLSTEDIDAAEVQITEGLKWLDDNREAEVEEVKEKQKEYEEKIRPTLMKLYASQAPTEAPQEAPQPHVDEVD
jgi:L1 cell adhesion molecule like protein